MIPSSAVTRPVIDGTFDPVGFASRDAGHGFMYSGQRVFHRKFGYGIVIAAVEGERNSSLASTQRVKKRVIASFVVDAAEAS